MLTSRGLQNACRSVCRRMAYARVSPQELHEGQYLSSFVRRILTRSAGAVQEEARVMANESSAAAGAKDLSGGTTAFRDTVGLDKFYGSTARQRRDEQGTHHEDGSDGRRKSRKEVLEPLIDENGDPIRDFPAEHEGSVASLTGRPRHQSASVTRQQSGWQYSNRGPEEARSREQQRRGQPDRSYKRDVAPRRGQRGVWHESDDGDLSNGGEPANCGSPKNRFALEITPRRSSQATGGHRGQWPSSHDSSRGEAYSRHAGKPWLRQNASQFSRGWEDEAGRELGASLSQQVIGDDTGLPTGEQAVDGIPRGSITERLRALALTSVAELRQQQSSRPKRNMAPSDVKT